MLHSFLTWLSRIHIGRWTSPADWLAAAEHVCRRQWKHPPSLPLADHIGLIARLHRHKDSKRLRFWHRASLVLALPPEETAAQLAPPKGLPMSIEWGVAAYAALKAGQSCDTPWIHDLASEFLRLAENADGTLPYSASLPHLRLVDTLWMACPFLYRYGTMAEDARYTLLARRQLEDYLARGLHPVTGLPAHSFALADGSPVGIYGWGRGCAFLLISLIESAELPDNPDRAWLIEQALACGENILRIQLPDGGWPWLPLAEDFPEASATAMLGYAFARLAAWKGNKAFCEAAVQAQACLMTMTRRDGTIDLAQGDTMGIGLYSARRAPMPLAQGYGVRLGKALAGNRLMEYYFSFKQ